MWYATQNLNHVRWLIRLSAKKSEFQERFWALVHILHFHFQFTRSMMVSHTYVPHSCFHDHKTNIKPLSSFSSISGLLITVFICISYYHPLFNIIYNVPHLSNVHCFTASSDVHCIKKKNTSTLFNNST